MAFSRQAGANKPAVDPEAAAWQAKLAEEQEERDRADTRSQAMAQSKASAESKKRAEENERKKRAMDEARMKASAEDSRWKETHNMYNSNLADSAARNEQQQHVDDEKARQLRIERSKAEAAKRAGGVAGGFGGGFGAGGGKSDFAWKKAAPASGGYSTGSGGVRSAPRADMGDLPSHDDCELAVSAMISRTLQGMKEGLRQLGLPDYPLKFIPGRELQLCGHDVREVVNEMIHAWMTDEKDDFYNVLLRIKSITADPILTEEEMSLIQHQEAWDKRDTPGASPTFVPKGSSGVGPAAKPKPAAPVDDDSEDEVIDLSSAPAARKEAPRPAAHNFAKPTLSAPADMGDDHYELLGIAPTATLLEIRMKFRQLVVTEHPEKGGDPKKFAKLNKAYGVLSDQEKRRAYDEQRTAAGSAKRFVD